MRVGPADEGGDETARQRENEPKFVHAEVRSKARHAPLRHPARFLESFDLEWRHTARCRCSRRATNSLSRQYSTELWHVMDEGGLRYSRAVNRSSMRIGFQSCFGIGINPLSVTATRPLPIPPPRSKVHRTETRALQNRQPRRRPRCDVGRWGDGPVEDRPHVEDASASVALEQVYDCLRLPGGHVVFAGDVPAP